MRYGTVHGVRKPVARLVHGTTMLSAAAPQEGMDLLDGVFAAGGTAFDAAHVYGNGECERVLGEWMERRGNRERVVVITKGCHHNPDRNRMTPYDLTADLMDSLARLRTDYVDLYLLHRDDPAIPVDGIVAAMAEHRAAGRIHAYGGSNWSAPRIEEANACAARRGLPAFAASSPNYSLAVQVRAPWAGCRSIGGPAAAADRDWYRRTRLPVFAWSSLAGGFFSGRFARGAPQPDAERDALAAATYRSDANFCRLEAAQAIGREHGVSAARVALAFIMQTGLDVYPIAAAATPAEFADNAAALDLRLAPGEIARLETAGLEQPDLT